MSSVLLALMVSVPVPLPVIVVPSSSVRMAPELTSPMSMAPLSVTLTPSSVAPPLPSLPPCSTSTTPEHAIVSVPPDIDVRSSRISVVWSATFTSLPQLIVTPSKVLVVAAPPEPATV